MATLSLFVIFCLAAGGTPVPAARAQKSTEDAQNPYVYSPAKLDFGQQLVDTQSSQRIAQLQNKSNKPRNFLVFKIEGQNPGDFKEIDDCSSFLAPGTSCALRVTFSPKDASARVASVKVTDSTGLSQTLTVSGLGTNTPPEAPSAAPEDDTRPHPPL